MVSRRFAACGRPETEALARTDAQIRDELLAAFDRDPRLETARIAAEVNNGVVTLTGTVLGQNQLVAVEDLTARVGGIRGVANYLVPLAEFTGNSTAPEPARDRVGRGARILYRLLVVWTLSAMFALVGWILIAFGLTGLTDGMVAVVFVTVFAVGGIAALLSEL